MKKLSKVLICRQFFFEFNYLATSDGMRDKTANFIRVGQNSRFWKRDKIADFDRDKTADFKVGQNRRLIIIQTVSLCSDKSYSR